MYDDDLLHLLKVSLVMQMQSQLLDSRLAQPMYVRPESILQTKYTQSLYPGWFGSHGWSSSLLTDPSSMISFLMLTTIVAGVGTIYHLLTRQVELIRWAFTPTGSDGAPTLGITKSAAETPTTASNGENGRDERDYEFLPPRERVIDHVRDNDGRVYQQELIQAMDRSASTVSRYLSDLESEGRITRVRHRRQNIVMIAGEEYDWSWEIPESPPMSK